MDLIPKTLCHLSKGYYTAWYFRSSLMQVGAELWPSARHSTAMQHSAQQRSATHAAEHTRAQEHTGITAAQLQHNIIAVTEHVVHNSEFIQIDKSSITIHAKKQNRAHNTVHARTARITQGTAQQRRARESTVMCGRAWPRTAPNNNHCTGPVTSYQSTQHITHKTQPTAQRTTHVVLFLCLKCLS